MKIDDQELWSVEVKAEDVISAITSKIYHYIEEYRIRREDIRAIALGPNEFNALRLRLMSPRRFFYHKSITGSLPNPEDVMFQNIPVHCAPRLGVQILLNGRWDVQIAEARKFLSLEGLDS